MKQLLATLARHAQTQPDVPALVSRTTTIRYRELPATIQTLHARLFAHAHTVGLLLDNSPAWALLDLAARAAECTVVPLPGFFSDAQLAHVLTDAGIDTIVTDNPRRVLPLVSFPSTTRSVTVADNVLSVIEIPTVARKLPHGIEKLTYTSGTTGTPKGVCLQSSAPRSVASSLVDTVGAETLTRHVCVLPLSTLLENIAGLDAPLLAGGTCCLPTLAELGMRGAAGVDARVFAHALAEWRASSVILVPQLLHALLQGAALGATLSHLRFVAVGGARVASGLLERARTLNIPVFEGYGLSECASVVALNLPNATRAGSVGKPLPHVRLRIAPDGEILLAGATMRGYLGDAAHAHEAWWHSGDLGHLDADGFLFVHGRKKNMFITAFGRNVAPEWVESELTASGVIAQAAVYGEARPWNIAVIVSAASDAAIARAIADVNARLPDYARVSRWLHADAAFSVANATLTANGRPRRSEIWRHYRSRIETLYLAEPSLEVAL